MNNWWKKTIILFLSFLLIIIASMIYIDPFFQYHAPLDSFNYNLKSADASYINPGIAKNFTYDSILLGSSMTQNFKTSQIDDLFNCKTVKLSYSGGKAKNYSIMMDLAFKNREIKNVFYGLDVNAFKGHYNETRNPLPEYLYDENTFNDTKYILNKSVIGKDLLNVILNDRTNNNGFNMDEYQRWYNVNEMGKDKVLAGYADKNLTSIQADIGEDSYLKNSYLNYSNNLEPYIIKNPETQFYIFLPPYSLLYWRSSLYKGELSAEIALLKQLVSNLNIYKNVTVFSFIDEYEIISNLDNYKDYTHYDERINDFMIETIYNKEKIINLENYENKLDSFKEFITDYDFDALLE